MAAHVVYQVLAGQAHHVVDYVVNEICRGVPAVPLPHVAVDGGKALAGGAAAFDYCLFNQDHTQVSPPVVGFKSGAATGHAAANYQNVALNDFRGWCRHV